MLKSAQGTRAASFSAKIRNLQEYHNRLLNGLSPFPSGSDIINVLKFFSQALLTILRDIPCLPIDLIRDRSRDSVRINFFPNLDYRTLYYALAQMLDSFPLIQSTLATSAPAVFEFLLHAVVCLVPFLEHELMDSMPVCVANTISLSFVSHQDIIDMLCYNILPFTLYHDLNNDSVGFANSSIPSILMVVLTHTDSLSLHSQLLECLMRLKKDVVRDLLVVIAYGTGKSRHAAVELLFQYWPGLNPSPLDRRTLFEKHVPWKPLTCQNDTCQNTLNNEAVKICFAQIECGNPSATSVSDCKGRPPIPLLICIDCAEMVREQSSMVKSKCTDVLLNVLHPMTEISYTCESKSCLSAASSKPYSSAFSTATMAVVTCFSPECTNFNSNKPVRLCVQCHQSRHQMLVPSVATTSDTLAPGSSQEKHPPSRIRHLVQEYVQSLWQLPLESQQHFTEAVISLLREASVLEKYSKDSGGVRTHGTSAYIGGGGGGGGGPGLAGGSFGPSGVGPSMGSGGFDGSGPGGATGIGTNPASDAVDSTIEERQLLSRYGIWMLIGLCDPTEATTIERMELLGRMLAMLCQWFHNTACLPDDQAGSALERIKSESIHGWLMKVIGSQFQLFANCLIPNPPDYAQIGGYWESWPSMTIHIKEGFKRLLCLVPYDIITADIWAYIMPFWMESFRYDLPEMELAELRILLSKVLDPDLSPLGLPPKQMYHFISICFEHMMPLEQEQALSWLQILTLLEIPVPINLLSSMFQSGITSFINLREMKEGKKVIETNLENIGNEGLVPQPSTSKLSPNRDNRFNAHPSPSNHPLLSIATIENIVESQLACYVLMLDILLKQFELQEVNAHKGFDTGRDAMNTIQLLYQMISVAHCTTAIGQVHTCCEYGNTMSTDLGTQIPKPVPPPNGNMQRHVSKPNSILNECFFCELSSIWYQLSLQLITYFAPLVEMTVMADIGSIHGTESDHSNICLSPLSTRHQQQQQTTDQPNPPPVAPSATDERSTLYSINEDQAEDQQQQFLHASSSIMDDPSSDQGGHSGGEYTEPEVEDEDKLIASIELNMTEKLTLKFLQELQLQSDPDVIYHLLQCLKLLTLHAGILNRMAQDEKRRKFFYWCQKRYLISTFWRLLQAEFSQISQISVPLLLHCISLPGGLSVFSRIVNEDFKHKDWCIRFATIERVGSFSQFVEQSAVKNSHFLQSALSSLIIHMIQTLDDVSSAVAQRTLLVLESMRTASLRLYVHCLEMQFDLVIVDRCLVLSSLLQLFNHLMPLSEETKSRRVLTWDFFLNRFDALFLEAQVFGQRNSDGSMEISEPTRDLRNTNVHSETFKKKLNRTHEALEQTHLKRSLLLHHSRHQKRHEMRNPFAIFGVHSTAGQQTVAGGSQPGSLTRKFGHHQKDQTHSKDKFKNLSAPSANLAAVNRKASKLAALTGSAFPANFFQESGPSTRDILQEELHKFNVIHRKLDEDATDHEPFHLLVFLLMQFLSWPDLQHPTEEKGLNRTQSIVFLHLNTLIGYNSSEGQFFLSAYDLRRKPIFSAFLSALPDALDMNLSIGNFLLPTVFPLMIFCPANHRFVYSSDVDTLMPTHSLWLLQSHLRHSWLSSLIVILYKHNYSVVPTYNKFVQLMIQIVMNTLESALEHRCSPTEALLRRSKDLRDTLNVDGEVETKTESITEEVVDQPMKASNRSTITVDNDDEMIGAEIMINDIVNGKSTTNSLTGDQPITIDIDIHEGIEFQPIEPALLLANQEMELANSGVRCEEDEKSSDSNTVKQQSESILIGHSTNDLKKYPITSSTSEDNESIGNKSLVDSSSFADNQSSTESSSQFGCFPVVPVTNNNQGLMTPEENGDLNSETTTTSTTPTLAGGCATPPLEICPACAASSSIPPPIERLLPIGGELSESVRITLSRRPYPSVIASSTTPTASPPIPTIPPPNGTVIGCCCCCQATNTGPGGVPCCASFQQTIETFKQQHATAVRELSRERLLPIGPKPVHHHPQQQQHSHHQQTFSSKSHHSSESRSVERATKHTKHHKPSNKLLVRQHTTIGSNNPTSKSSSPSASVPHSILLSSKSVDSVPDNFKFKSQHHFEPRNNHHKQMTVVTVATTTNSSTSSVIVDSTAANNIDDLSVHQTRARKSTTTSNNSEESICGASNSNKSPRSAALIACNGGGEGFDETATESDQETSKSSSKGPSRSSRLSNGDSKEVIANGFSNEAKHGKDKLKKKAKKKSKKNKSTKSTPISTASNTPNHQNHNHQGSSSPTGGLPSSSITSGGPCVVGAESPMTTGDNEVFANQSGSSEFVSGAKRTQADSTKDSRSNEASSSSHSDLSSTAYEMCTICGLPIEKFDEQELGLCLISLATFVHRDAMLAAPMLPQILRLTSRYAIRRVFPWQMESNVHLPANTASIARQFIRCTLHQLNSNGIFRQIFQSHISDVILFRSIAISLADFVELNQVTPLKELFESLMEDKQFPSLQVVQHTLSNVANYFECVFVDYNTSQGCNFALSGLSPLVCSLIGASAPNVGASIVANQPWSELMAPFESYLRKLSFALSHLAPSIHNLVPVMRVLLALFKIPGIGVHRSILDPVMKILAHIVQHSPLLLEHVRELCILCSRAYVRDRERLCIARTFALELVQALRFRTHLPDENILLLVQWALEDSGGSLPYSMAAQSLERTQNKALGQTGISVELSSTNATEALRMHISELLDFVGDVHALARLKSNFQGTSVHLNEETLGGHLKAGIAQFLSLELTRTGGTDHRAITKYLPWLYSLPSLQQGPKEFLECISHVRLLSWLLLGSLQHSALMKCHPNQTTCLVSQPIPLEASTHIAEHVQAILAGFAEQSKTSVLHMSALFYAFLLCQLWTVYCEQLAGQNPPGSDAAHQSILVLSDFWSKVTPGVLQLICHSKGEGFQQLADTVSLHFLSLMETLMECNSEILCRLIPLWLPLFNSYQGQLSGNTRVRLQTIVSWPCPPQTRDDAMMASTILIRWLQRIQTKMSQIEMQSSTAIQFYCI